MSQANTLKRWLAVGLLALVGATHALAEDDPPGRVGRIAEVQGGVSRYDDERGEWTPAVRNRPLTGGDRVSTDNAGRVELRVGSTTLRLGSDSELEVLRLDDDRVKVQLHSGSLAVRVRSREAADELEVVTEEATLHPLRGGRYRVDRQDDSTFAAAWRGELRVEDKDRPFTVDTGRRVELWREGRGDSLRRNWTSIPDDEFSDWVAREDRRDERSASNRYVSPEMTGAEDLDRYGRWEQHPEYGPVWTPTVVVGGWAPYRYGHWAWISPWGWTWVDDAPWGFAPFHYGRWVSWGGRWCWYPGSYVARPVYAPALVAWVGGANFSVSIQVGGPALPAVGWVPLAPREVFVPYYRSTPVYVGRVNHRPGPMPVPQVPTGPVMYGNQGVPNAVTVVPRDVLSRREPVARAVVDLRDEVRRPLPIQHAAPVQAPQPVANAPVARPVPGVPLRPFPGRSPGAVIAVPGGAEPARGEGPPSRREGGGPRNNPPAVAAPAQPTAPQQGVVDLRRQQREQREQRDLQAAQERERQRQAAQDRANQERAARERDRPPREQRPAPALSAPPQHPAQPPQPVQPPPQQAPRQQPPAPPPQPQQPPQQAPRPPQPVVAAPQPHQRPPERERGDEGRQRAPEQRNNPRERGEQFK